MSMISPVHSHHYEGSPMTVRNVCVFYGDGKVTRSLSRLRESAMKLFRKTRLDRWSRRRRRHRVVAEDRSVASRRLLMLSITGRRPVRSATSSLRT